MNHENLRRYPSNSMRFPMKMKKAMKVVERILSNTRNPRLASPSDVHTYNDKFALSEFLSKTAILAIYNALEKLGLDKTTLRHLVKVVTEESKTVTLRFASNEKCKFIKEDTIRIEGLQHEVERKGGEGKGKGKGSNTSSTTTKIFTAIRQYHWKIEVDYKIDVYEGNAENSKVLLEKKASCKIITRGTAKHPFKPFVTTEPLTVSLTWILQHVNTDTLRVEFGIDRDATSCRTPRNNNETCDARFYFGKIIGWCESVNYYLVKKEKEVMSVQPDTSLTNNVYLQEIKTDGIFVPVLPLFESSQEDGSRKSPLLSVGDLNLFLAEQCRTMSEQIEIISAQCSPCVENLSNEKNQLMSSAEGIIVLLTSHIQQIAKLWHLGIDHIEDMLCTQLYNAIGKSVRSEDLFEYVRFHNQRLFSDTYAPEPFCYAIRRPDHFPDGIISMEEQNANGNVMMFTRKLENKKAEYPIYIPINSATSVEFKGDLYLHGWMLQRFQEKPSYTFTSRARQFSCFLLLIGKLSGPDTFQPEHGIILQNKDEILIPLLLEEIPSSKEFKDAISSLSPEQQKFAKSFRNMKLSSSVFGICVVQLKPQLEVLLGLPSKSLTKHIRLTQNLLTLFIEYQVPSDLLSYDGPDDVESSEKVDIVQSHVNNVLAMIADEKKKDLAKAQSKAEMKHLIYSACEEECEECEEEMDVGGGVDMFGGGMCGGGGGAEEKQATLPSIIINEINDSKRNNDLTIIPKLVDRQFEKITKDDLYNGALRNTVIKPKNNWTKTSRANLLSDPNTLALDTTILKVETDKAFDLLDALSRSGSLPLKFAELHVIVASTHCFEKSVVNTVVQDNINPIEKIETSNLLLASVIHSVQIHELLCNKEEIKRIQSATLGLVEDRSKMQVHEEKGVMHNVARASRQTEDELLDIWKVEKKIEAWDEFHGDY